MTARGIGARALDLLWPRRCAVEGCGRPVDRPGRYICSACFAALPYADGNCCRVCGALPAADEPAGFVCGACRAHPPGFDLCRSALRHMFAAQQLLLEYKFARRTWLLADLTDLLEAAARARLDSAAVDAVVPVPLYVTRRLLRGFNQAELLAAGLARRLGRRCLPHALARVRDTGHQARLGAAARRANVRGAFAARRPADLKGRTVLLVDDVATTGATLSECATALKQGGAARVWCLTVARKG